jgi:hypothetical protein
MTITEWAVTVSATGTFFSATIAVLTYVVSTLQKYRQATQHDAEQIREQLRKLQQQITIIETVLLEGSALIAGAAAVCESVYKKLPSSAKPDDLKKIIRNEGLMLSCCVTGWQDSALSSRISEMCENLKVESTQLSGGLALLREPISLVVSITVDGYSPMMFRTILEQFSESGILANKIDWDQSPRSFLNDLVVRLHSGTATYFVTRYDDAIREIRKFVDVVVSYFLVLPDGKLIALIREPIGRSPESASKTGEMNRLIRGLRAYLTDTDTNALLTMTENIERFVSKEYASNRLSQMERRR